MPWDSPNLMFVVREPFISRHSAAEISTGLLKPGDVLTMESNMPCGGVIFSDGVESDYMNFNAGTVARIHAAEQRARLVLH